MTTTHIQGDPFNEFRAFIGAHGFEAPERLEPGHFVRFSTKDGRRGDTAGYAKLFPDLEGGIVGDFRTGDQWTWQTKREQQRTPAEQRTYRERCERERAAARAEHERELKETAERAVRIGKDNTTPAEDSHGYLKLKGIKGHGARVYKGSLALRGVRCDGALAIPRRTVGGDLVSWQFIPADGKEKRYLNGPVPPGTYFGIGKPNGVLCVVEGFATGASVHEATGHAVAVVFDSGNMPDAGIALRGKFPDVRLVYCADDDWKVTRNGEPHNPGMEAATAAASATGGLVAVPAFPEDRPDKATDFNDLATLLDAEAVRRAIEAAQPPAPPPTDQPVPENRATAIVAGEWPQPKPLPEGLPAVKALTSDLMPDALRPWVEDIGDRLQCPLDFVGAAAMVAAGAVIGRKVGIRPQQETDWTEFPNLWGCIVGRPSVMKSPALEQALAPLRRLTAKAVDEHLLAKQAFEAKAHLIKLQREAADAEIRKRLKMSVAANVSDLQLPEPEEPQLRRYIANDTSYESLGDLLAHNPNGVLVHRDELVSLLKSLDREDNAGARGFYLTGWAGNSPYTFDRITRKGAALDAVCLSLLGTTQPGRIASYIHDAHKGGAGDDGLIQRFGLFIWPDTDRDWRDVDRWPDSDARRSAFEVFDRLDKLDAGQIDAEQDTDRDGIPTEQPYLRLNGEALSLFRDWRQGWENRLARSDDSPAVVSHFAKYRKLVPALALICHLADQGRGPVNRVSMLRALAWAEYLEGHARRAYASLDVPEHAAAKAIIERLRRGDLEPTFQARDVYRKGWSHLSDRQLVQDALDLLTDLDWLAVVEVSGRETGGRARHTYQANPRGLSR